MNKISSNIQWEHTDNKGVEKYYNHDWGIIAFDFHKDKLENKFTDEELNYNCIYLLIGNKGPTEKVYVGQARKRNGGYSVLSRLREHLYSNTEKYRNDWEHVMVFTQLNDTWGVTELSVIEYLLYNEIKEENRLNGNTPSSGGIDDINKYTDRIRYIKEYVKAAQYNIFNTTENMDNVRVVQVEEIVDKTKRVKDLHKSLSKIPEIVTPNYLVKQMVDKIPQDMFNPESRFFDPACKSGEYLREIYDRLMETESLMAKYKDPFERHTHILTKQLFGIALSEISLERATKNLKGLGINIRIVNDYLDIIKGKNKKTIQDVIREEFGDDMQFDVVIGNPPYQEMTGGGGSGKRGIPLAPYFVLRAKEILGETGKLIMIIPTRWYSQPEKIYEDTREALMDGHLKKMVDFTDATECFKGVSIAGGVSYFIYDRSYNGMTEMQNSKSTWEMDFSKPSIILRGKEVTEVYKKVRDVECNNKTFGDVVSSVNYFGLLRSVRGSVIETDYCNIKLKHSDGYGYINKEDVTKNADQIENYKIITGYMNGSTDKVLSSVEILGPNEVCTLTYLVLGIVQDKDLAERIKEYFETKFVRFLIKGTVTNSTLTRNNYSVVPLQDFRKTWTDKELYEKYNLTQEEIDYIEKTIPAMN